MGFKVEIGTNIFDIMGRYPDLTMEAVKKAGWRSINATLVTLRAEAAFQARKVIKLKSGELKREFMAIKKAKGGSLGSQWGALTFTQMPIPLLHFVKGTKAPRSQKGVKVIRRRPIKYEIIPGKIMRSKSGFIARVNTVQVFKRKPSGRLAMQGTPSLAHVLNKHGVTQRLANMGADILQRNFIRDLDFRMEKLRRELSNSPIKTNL